MEVKKLIKKAEILGFSSCGEFYIQDSLIDSEKRFRMARILKLEEVRIWLYMTHRIKTHLMPFGRDLALYEESIKSAVQTGLKKLRNQLKSKRK